MNRNLNILATFTAGYPLFPRVPFTPGTGNVKSEKWKVKSEK